MPDTFFGVRITPAPYVTDAVYAGIPRILRSDHKVSTCQSAPAQAMAEMKQILRMIHNHPMRHRAFL